MRAEDANWVIRDLVRTLEAAELFIRHKPDCEGAQCEPPKLPECDCGMEQMRNEIERSLALAKEATA